MLKTRDSLALPWISGWHLCGVWWNMKRSVRLVCNLLIRENWLSCCIRVHSEPFTHQWRPMAQSDMRTVFTTTDLDISYLQSLWSRGQASSARLAEGARRSDSDVDIIVGYSHMCGSIELLTQCSSEIPWKTSDIMSDIKQKLAMARRKYQSYQMQYQSSTYFNT